MHITVPQDSQSCLCSPKVVNIIVEKTRSRISANVLCFITGKRTSHLFISQKILALQVSKEEDFHNLSICNILIQTYL